MDTILHEFCTEQRELLKLELLQSEESSSLPASETKQNVLHALQVHDISVGLYGKTLVQLKQTNVPFLPAHRFTTGDEVEIQSRRSNTSIGGILHQVTDDMISVALFSHKHASNKNKKNSDPKNSTEDDDDEDDFVGTPPLSLLPKSSIEVHKKLLMALDELEQHGIDHPVAGTVIERVFQVPCEDALPAVPPQQQQPSLLDDSQKEAIQMALHQPVGLIHGPPGTGKTTTVVELIHQAVLQHNYRVLVTAPSNVAVDQILSRLVQTNKKLRVVRLGHPARLHADILPYSLEAMVQAADGTEIVQDVREELQTWLRKVNHPKMKYADKVTARREIKLLRQEIRQREQKVVQDLLQRAQVVLATCVGAANRLLSTGDRPFDLVIVDEAAQSLEAACWIPILRGSRLVLAGDHCQLPPTIQCNDLRVQEGLGRTMFARIMKLYENNPTQISRMLKVQYRMHESIANWASEAMYHGELNTHESAQGRTLATLPGVLPKDGDEDLTQMPLLLMDTAGCDCYESTNAAGSRFNRGEAYIVQQHVQKLLDMGVPASQIAVITPYNGQVELLKSMGMSVEVRTVDGFQGGEREAVVLSLVRSSAQKGSSIGFLRDDRRLNVAVTRAKRHCCVVADSETVSSSPFVKSLIDWIEQHGEQRSAMDYMTDDILAELHLEVQEQLRTSKENDVKKKKSTDSVTLSSVERDALLERVRAFHQTGRSGDELVLSYELSKGDRHAVHELAEELGVLHISTGTEGIDRRMTLSIPLTDRDDLPATTDRKDSNTDHMDDVEEAAIHDEPEVSPIPAFHVLQEDEESSVSEDERTSATTTKATPPTIPPVAGNKTSKKKKKSKQKAANEVVVADDDDMAFLDAEIDKVQNSHGRTVFGKGPNYRTIVNGILLARPNPVEKKANPRATSALQAKLKQAEESRKAKAKPKKK